MIGIMKMAMKFSLFDKVTKGKKSRSKGITFEGKEWEEAMNKQELKEVERRLKNVGYAVASCESERGHCRVLKDKKYIGTLFENGNFTTNADPEVSRIIKETKEYLIHYRHGDSLIAEGLRAGYKKILEYNGHVLAMKKIPSIESYEFVTWRYATDGRSVNIGHYFSDYPEAKEDFALRAGLLDPKRIFSESQMKVIYTSLISYVGSDPFIDVRTEKGISAVLEKIRDMIPELVDQMELEYEGMLIDDGIEV